MGNEAKTRPPKKPVPDVDISQQNSGGCAKTSILGFLSAACMTPRAGVDASHLAKWVSRLQITLHGRSAT